MARTRPLGLREQFGFTLSRIGRIWRNRLDSRLVARGHSYARWSTLAYLSRGGEGMLQKELARYMGIEAPTLVRNLDHLEREGLIRRRPHPDDRRAKTVHLAPPAADVVTEFDRVADEIRETLLDGIDDADLEVCLRVLDRIDRNAGTHDPRAGELTS